MATTVGQLTIEMAANVARLRSDMDEAKRVVGGAASEIQSSIGFLKEAFAGVAAAFSVREILGEAKRVTEFMADMTDQAEMAGTSVENLSKYIGVAAAEGKSIGDVTALVAQLAKAMLGVEADTGRAAGAFKAMGLDLSGFTDGTEALEAFAQKMAGYENDTNKTQLAIAAWGKAGASAIPLINALGSAHGTAATMTTAQAEEAKKLTKELAAMQVQSDLAKQSLLSGMIPALSDLLGRFNAVRGAGVNLVDTLQMLSRNDQNNIQIDMSTKLAELMKERAKWAQVAAAAENPAYAAKMIADIDKQAEYLGKVLMGSQAITNVRLKNLGLLTDEAKILEKAPHIKTAAELQAEKDARDAAAKSAQRLNEEYLDAIGISKDYTERVKQLETLLKTGRLTQDQYTEAVKRLGESQPVVKQYTKDQETAQKELNAAIASATGVSVDYTKNVKALEAALGTGAITQDQYTEAIKKLGESQPIVKQYTEDQTKASKDLEAAQKKEHDTLKELAKLYEEAQKPIRDQTAEVDKAIQAQKDENEKIGLTKDALANLTAKRVDEKTALINQQIEEAKTTGALGTEYQALVDLKTKYEQSAQLIREGSRLTAIQDEAKKAADAYKETSSTIEKSLTDALLRGFEGGKGFAQNLVQSMKNLFNTLILRPVIQAVVQPVAGAITGMFGLTGTANAAGSGLNALSGVGGASTLFGEGSFMSSFFGGASATSEAALALGEIGAGGAAAASGGAFAALGTALPYLGVGLAVASAMGLFGSKHGPKSGGSYDSSGSIGRLFTPADADQSAGTIGAGILDSIKTTVGDLGGTAADLQLAFGFDKDPLGTAGSRLASLLRTKSGNVLVNDMAGVNVGRDDSTFTAGVASESARLVLAGIQASTLPDNIRAIFDRLDASTVTSDELATAIKDAKALVPKSDAQTALDAALNDPGTQAAVSTEVSRLIDLQTDAYNELKAQGQDRRDIGTSASQAAATLAAIGRDLVDQMSAVRQAITSLATAPDVVRA